MFIIRINFEIFSWTADSRIYGKILVFGRRFFTKTIWPVWKL